MKIEEIRSKKARKWAKKNKDCDNDWLVRAFSWEETKQGGEFWYYIEGNNPTTKELKKKFPKLFKK